MPTLYAEVGKHAGLDRKQLQRYMAYMIGRWPKGVYDTIYNPEGKTSFGYAFEWAERFKAGKEYQASDLEGQALLKRIDEVLE